MLRTTQLALLLNLIVIVPALPALAGYEIDCMGFIEQDLPHDGATDVPLNPMIVVADLLSYQDDSMGADVDLYDPMGNRVSLDHEFLTTDCVPVYFPESDLEPETEYTLMVSEVEALRFVTGVDSDHTSPAFEVGTDEDDWGVFVEFTGDDDIVLIATEWDIELGTRGMALPVEDGYVDLSFAGGQVEDGDVLTLTAYDAAGNATAVDVTVDSPWLDEPTPPTGSGCSVVGSAPGAHWVAALLAMAAFTMRGRRA